MKQEVYLSVLSKLSTAMPLFAKAALDIAIRKHKTTVDEMSASDFLEILEKDIDPLLAKIGKTYQSVLLSGSSHIITDNKNKLVYLNSAARRLISLHTEGKTLDPDQQFKLLCSLGLMKDAAEINGLEIREFKDPQTKRHYNVTHSPIFDSLVNLKGVSSVIQDLTLKEELQTELKDAYKASSQIAEASLQESDTRLRLATGTAGIGFWEMDLTSRSIWHSNIHDSVFGYKQEIKEWTLEIFFNHVFPEDRKYVQKKIEECIKSESEIDIEYRIVWPDGSVHWVSNKGKVQIGPPKKLLGLVFDITTRKKFEDDLREAKIAAEEASLAKSRFLANISHEIRSPLGVILGLSELFKDPTVQPEEKLKFIDMINKNGENLLSLVEDILDLSKIEAGSLTLKPETVPLRNLLKDLMDSLQIKAADKTGLTLKTTIQDGIPSLIRTDPVRLRQILLNLLNNAIRFTDRGQIELCVGLNKQSEIVATLRDGNTHIITFSVKDTGIGISSDQQAKLFQRFSQLDSSPSRKLGGTGIGLNLSRQLAKILGGDVFLESSIAGQGSVFVTYLPVEAVEELSEQPKKKAENAELKSLQNILEGMTLLLAEDSEDNQFLLKYYLSHFGACVDIANNGDEAVKMAGAKNYDCILMDMQMPVLDGYEATRTLRQKGFNCPIIALTAHAMVEDRQRCLESGCNDYATKPIDAKHLASILLSQKKNIWTKVANRPSRSDPEKDTKA